MVKWCRGWEFRVKEGIQGEMTNSKDLWKSYWEKATAIIVQVSKIYTYTSINGVAMELPYNWGTSAYTRHCSLSNQSSKTVVIGYLFGNVDQWVP